MRTPTLGQLLGVWERGGELSLAARALSLLGVAADDPEPDALAALPLGRRDALLIELRARLFGPEIVGLAACPSCGAEVEAAFRCGEMLPEQARSDGLEGATHRPQDVLQADDVRVRFRLPNSADLLALDTRGGAASARATLLSRCVLEAVRGHQSLAAEDLPPGVAAAVADAMSAADPVADLHLAFACPDCGHSWETAFDIARFLWEELQGWAPRLLREVDALARAYHWSETDILALSPRRRQAYLEMCAP